MATVGMMFRIVSYGYDYPLSIEAYSQDERTRWACEGHIEMSGFATRAEAEMHLPQLELIQQAYKHTCEG